MKPADRRKTINTNDLALFQNDFYIKSAVERIRLDYITKTRAMHSNYAAQMRGNPTAALTATRVHMDAMINADADFGLTLDAAVGSEGGRVVMEYLETFAYGVAGIDDPAKTTARATVYREITDRIIARRYTEVFQKAVNAEIDLLGDGVVLNPASQPTRLRTQHRKT